MVTRDGRYYGIPFKGNQRVTNGDPGPPTIFNMVVDAVIFRWFTLVVGGKSGLDGFGGAVQWLAEFFYIDGGLLAFTRRAQIRAALDVLTGLFDRVDLQNNVNKKARMVSQTCKIVGGHFDVAYMQRMKVASPSFWERQQERVHCLEYDMELVAGLLAFHL